MFFLALLLGSGSFHSSPIREHVDLIELNHKFDERGCHTFSQVIFWERSVANGKYRVRDWVIVDDRESLCSVPVKEGGIYVSTFIRNGIFYSVRSPLFRESWTQTDPEIEDGKRYPKHLRRLLAKPIPNNLIRPNRMIENLDQ
jgi:hypothetical protein